MNKLSRFAKTTLLLVFLIIAGYQSNAQFTLSFNPLVNINNQLRGLFSPLWHPVPEPRFLYEMAAHSLDSNYFDDNNPDTLNRDVWYKIYDEMRTSAYDTNYMLPMMQVFTNGQQYRRDSVVMNIMCYNYLKYNDSALTSDKYYDFDSVNNIIIERVNGEISPYDTNRVFAASPISYTLPYKTVTYLVKPQFIFHDLANNFAAKGWQIRIDFGDGTGWHLFNPTTSSAYVANYTTPGTAIIRTQVLDPMLGMAPIMSSKAKVIVPNRITLPPPQSKINRPWLTASVYNPCSESGGPLKKTIIYVEGYDPGDFTIAGNRNAEEIYDEMIASNDLADLMNFGYSFVVVDWKQSGRDIKDNGMALVDLINYLKCEHGDITPDDQYIIMAESMGGLAARYAMCYMENVDGGPCSPEKMHNTRLLITLDSPHEGANIPLAFQHIYRSAASMLMGGTLTQIVAGSTANILLDAKAVKQMLLYHVDTWNPFTNNYSEHSERSNFKTDLSNIGNFPQYCKMVAMSNGSLKGRGQTHVYDAVQRTPNDYLLDVQSQTWVRVFRDDIQLLGQRTELKTSPSGSGTLFKPSFDVYCPEIKIKITYNFPFRLKIKIQVSSYKCSTVGMNIAANNMQPYDVIPGSVEDAGASLISDENDQISGVAKALFFGFQNPTYNPTTHVWSIPTTWAGGAAFAAGKSASMYTDGMHFCFIPVFSALSYNKTTLYENIEDAAIATKTAATPFDVITGITENYPLLRSAASPFPTTFNRTHLVMRNDILGRFSSGVDLGDPDEYVYYDTCGGIRDEEPISVRFLNREIGDDTLWVDNRITDWSCIYDAEKYLGIDEHNPYYQYPGISLTSRVIPGIYSKDALYTINSGISNFMTRNSSTGVVVLGWHAPGSYTISDIDWTKCCNQYPQNTYGPRTGRRDSDETTSTSSIPNNENEYFTVSPNPSYGNDLSVRFSSKDNEIYTIQIFNIQGSKIWESNILAKEGNNTSRLQLNDRLIPGTYIMVLRNGYKKLHKTLIVN